MTRVVVLGGGMGGLVVADELSSRGFEVAVFEKWDRWGGKARSFGRYGSGQDGRADLPGEHGFRFFPGFYKHVPASMQQIPRTRAVSGTVFDDLVQASTVVIGQSGGKPRLQLPSRFPQTKAEWRLVIDTFRNRAQFGIPMDEVRTFGRKMLDLMAMSHARREAELTAVPWWTYIEADRMGEQYKTLLATGLTRSLVAMRAEVACTRTVGDILIQMLIYALMPGKTTDRVLDGPTSDVWIEPWQAKLSKQGVQMTCNATVRSLELDGDRIRAARIVCDGEEREVTGDYFVCAVPVEVMATLVDDAMAARAPSLGRLKRLQVEWMNGIVFYLKRDVPIARGHCILANSTWALTAISQPQFWTFDLAGYGAGTTRGLLSIDISNWTAAGDQVICKPAEHCSALEIATEAWAQIKAHFPELSDDDLIAPLEDPHVRSWFFDPDIDTRPCEPGAPVGQGLRGLQSVERLLQCADPDPTVGIDIDAEPLLINTVGSWVDRPHAATEIPNLLLASDYVRTHTDLATMEGANEAGRRAVNHILDRERSEAPRCAIYPLREMVLFAPFRGLDGLLFKLGLPAINWNWLWHLGLTVARGVLHFVEWIERVFGRPR